MDTPVVKVMTIAASVAMAIVLIAVGWNILGDQTPDTGAGTEFASIKDWDLCKILGGTPTPAAKPSDGVITNCAAPTTATTAASTTSSSSG